MAGSELARPAKNKLQIQSHPNGQTQVLLDEKVTQYLNEQGIFVVLSLDGRREVHDAMRPKPGGDGSYDIVLDRIKRFVKLQGR